MLQWPIDWNRGQEDGTLGSTASTAFYFLFPNCSGMTIMQALIKLKQDD